MSAPPCPLPRSPCPRRQHAVVRQLPARRDYPAVHSSSDDRRGWAQLRHLAPHSTQCGSPMYPVGRPSEAMVTAPLAAPSGAALPPTRRNHSEPHSQRAGASVVRLSRAAARSRRTKRSNTNQLEKRRCIRTGSEASAPMEPTRPVSACRSPISGSISTTSRRRMRRAARSRLALAAKVSAHSVVPGVKQRQLLDPALI